MGGGPQRMFFALFKQSEKASGESQCQPNEMPTEREHFSLIGKEIGFLKFFHFWIIERFALFKWSRRCPLKICRMFVFHSSVTGARIRVGDFRNCKQPHSGGWWCKTTRRKYFGITRAVYHHTCRAESVIRFLYFLFIIYDFHPAPHFAWIRSKSDLRLVLMPQTPALLHISLMAVAGWPLDDTFCTLQKYLSTGEVKYRPQKRRERRNTPVKICTPLVFPVFKIWNFLFTSRGHSHVMLKRRPGHVLLAK